MQALQHLSGLVCPLPLSNVDTDQLIPARFMKTPRSAGYGDFLLHDLRRDDSGQLKLDWPLNTPTTTPITILVSRSNFGAGSSREAAVYALVDHGIRCVMAPSFGDIFSSNAVNNGLLPAVIDEACAEEILSALGHRCLAATLDLDRQTFQMGALSMRFDIKPHWKQKLLNGWDDIALTLSMKSDIDEFQRSRRMDVPWLSP
jgi:3-isopropylmalate/(R)-2-methylmalate dehydratase small subunit